MNPGQYTLEVLRGLTSSRDLLSCNPAGKVDLWSTNDLSGRQIWSFESTGDGFFKIRVSGGVDDPNRVYLTGQGQRGVILAQKSAAIHQQWQLSPLNDPTQPDLYNLLNRICEADDYQYLSCTPDGGLVDRWMKDDGQGRQKWQLQGRPIPPG